MPDVFRQHRRLVILFFIASMLDLITTCIAVRLGFTEKNPLIADLVMNHIWLAAIFKVSGTLVVMYGLLLLRRIEVFYWFNVEFLFVASANALGIFAAELGMITPY